MAEPRVSWVGGPRQRASLANPSLRSSAGAAEVPGEQVAGGAVQVAAAAVVTAGGARGGVAHGVLQVAQAGAGVQVQGGEGVPHRVRRQADGQLLWEAGGAAEAAEQG